MTRTFFLIAATLALLGAASPAAAACYADYKAKQDDPLRLHYGVAEVRACSRAEAEAELRARLDRAGWTLLNVLAVFDDAGLTAERRESAGPFFLRF